MKYLLLSVMSFGLTDLFFNLNSFNFTSPVYRLYTCLFPALLIAACTAYKVGVKITEKSYLIGIFIASLAIRTFYLIRVMSLPNYMNTGSDGPLYHQYALDFINGNNMTEPLVAGYWMFLGLIYKFTTNYFVVCTIQNIFSALSVVLVYYIAKHIFNERVARISGVFAMANFLMIFSGVGIAHQVMDTFLILFAIFLLLRKHILAGIILGLAIATREMTLLYFLMIIPFMKKQWLVIPLVILTLVPFGIRNINNIGTPYPVVATEGADWPILESYLIGESPELSSVIDYKNMKLKAHPLVVAKIMFKVFKDRAYELFCNQGYGGFDLFFLVRGSKYNTIMWFIFYVFAIIGIVLAFWNRVHLHGLLFLFLFSRVGIHFVTECWYRHRVALEPFVIMYFAYGICEILKNRKKR